MRKTLKIKALRWQPTGSPEALRDLAGFERGRIDLVPAYASMSDGQDQVDIHVRFSDPAEARRLYEIFHADGAIDGEVDYRDGARIETLSIKNRRILQGELIGFRGPFVLHVTTGLLPPLNRYEEKR